MCGRHHCFTILNTVFILIPRRDNVVNLHEIFDIQQDACCHTNLTITKMCVCVCAFCIFAFVFVYVHSVRACEKQQKHNKTPQTAHNKRI